MSYNYRIWEGSYLSEHRKRDVSLFLESNGISFEPPISYVVIVFDINEDIIAVACLYKYLIKCVAVSNVYRGQDIMSTIISKLISSAHSNGYKHLFLYTKPSNFHIFSSLGFYTILKTNHILYMENVRNGISSMISDISAPFTNDLKDNIGAIVANCNPLTNGHLYLFKYAASRCDKLHIFILEEDASFFPTKVRYDIVKKACSVYDNIYVHYSTPYIISAATMPEYFLKDNINSAKYELDLLLFAKYFSPAFNIKKRYIGTEPFSPLTEGYNIAMKNILPKYNIDVIEIPRYSVNSIAISASEIRRLCLRKDYESIKNIVPDATYEYIISDVGQALINKKINEETINNE